MATPLTSLATARVLACWQRQGLDFSFTDYLRIGRDPEQIACLEQLESLAQSYSLPQDECLWNARLAVAAGDNDWREQLAQLVWLPWLANQLSCGVAIVGLVKPWTAPPLALTIRISHVRWLAQDALNPSDSDYEEKLLALLSLLDLARETTVEPNLAPKLAGQLAIDVHSLIHQDYLADVLRSCDTYELAPLLLSRVSSLMRNQDAVSDAMVPEVTNTEAVVSEVVDRLQSISHWLTLVGTEALIPQFQMMVVALLTASVRPADPLRNSFLYRLLAVPSKFERVCNLVGIKDMPDVPPWYLNVAHYIDEELKAHASALRTAWADDVGSMLLGRQAGTLLVGPLFRASFFESRTVDGVPVTRLSEILASARGLLEFDPTPWLEAVLCPSSLATQTQSDEFHRPFASAEPLPMLQGYVYAVRCLNSRLSLDCRAVVRGKLVFPQSPASGGLADDPLVVALCSLGDSEYCLERCVGRTAFALRTTESIQCWEHTIELVTLLWEMMLGVDAEHPSFRVRIERLRNLARIDAIIPALKTTIDQLQDALCEI